MKLYPKPLNRYADIVAFLLKGYTVDVPTPPGDILERRRVMKDIQNRLGSKERVHVLDWDVPHDDGEFKLYPIIRVAISSSIKDNEDALGLLKGGDLDAPISKNPR